MGNSFFAEPWDAATCLPWSRHVGLGAGETPDPQPGVQGLAPAFSRVGLVLFFAARVDLVWPMGPSLFCWAPAKRGWLSGGFFCFLFLQVLLLFSSFPFV